MLIALVAMISLAGAVGMTQRERLKTWYGRMSMLQTQRQCMDYSPPPDQIVFEKCTGPQVATGYAATGRYEEVSFTMRDYPGSGWPEHCVLRMAPDALKRLCAYYMPWLSPRGPIFLHGRQDPNGTQRLVQVQVTSMYDTTPGYNLRLETELAIPGTWQTNPSPRYAPEHYTFNKAFLSALNRPGTVRLYAGQADSVDPTHFTIDYEIDGQRGTIDGWVRTTLTVEYTIRTGPAADAPAQTFSP